MSRRGPTQAAPVDIQLHDALDRIDDLKDDVNRYRSRARVAEAELQKLKAAMALQATSSSSSSAAHPRYLDGSDPSPRTSLHDPYHRSNSPSTTSVDQLKRTIRHLKDDLASTQISLAESCSRVDSYREEARVLRGKVRHLSQFVAVLQEENRRVGEAVTNQGGEMGVLRAQLDDAISLAQTRGKELVGSQVFLTKADSLSVAEITERVEQLNHEIFQAAAYLGESLQFAPYNLSPEELKKVSAEATRIVGPLIGGLLIEHAKQPQPKVNDFVAQIVGQVLLCTFCSELVHSWYPDDTACGDFLSALYVNIRLQEEAAVSGRWRSLTRRYMRPGATEKWRTSLLASLNVVMKFASWQAPDSSRRKSFEGQLEHIFKAVIIVREAIGEAFTSSDIELVITNPGLKFDKTTMDDAWGDANEAEVPKGRKAPEEIVAGTTGLGIRMITKVDGAETVKMVSSPKVVLESTLRSSSGD